MGTNGNPGRKVFVFKPACINWNEYYGRIEAYIRTGFRYARAMKKVLQNISQLLMQNEISSVTTTFSAKVPQYYANLDRNRAKALGVDLNDVFSTMGSVFRNYYVNDFDKSGRTFQVLISAESSYRNRPEDLRYTYVRSNTGDMIPSLPEDMRLITGLNMERFIVFPAAKERGLIFRLTPDRQ